MGPLFSFLGENLEGPQLAAIRAELPTICIADLTSPFVHSDLTTVVQVADIVAYVIAWGVRVGGMGRPARHELRELARMVCSIRHRASRDRGGDEFYVWSFAVIDDLRPRNERE